ncbi:hypothetical protein M422DRAFT_109292, partial [Sphaerobolus stellatus SS14]
GFFKAHRDTPKSEQHLGTLIVGLPSAFTGDSLRFSHKEREHVIDWSDIMSKFQEKNTIPWAFLFSDVEHEVLP